MSLALSFHAVSKKYKDLEALSSVSFHVQKGEFFALLGQNGAGKTTLIGCLSGLNRRTGGDISVFGKDPEKDSVYTKSILGIVPQELVFDPFFTPLEALRFQRGLFGCQKNDEYLFWLLKKLSLWDKKNAESMKLSGGMKRRLMIAKALAHEPEILILDEPTAGVDVDLRKSLWAFLGELQEEKGITILLTTHYLEEAEALSDRVAVLHKGEIIVCENTKNLLGRHGRIVEIEKTDGTTETEEINSDTNVADVLAQKSDIANVHIREPKLEDIFLEITSK